MAFTLMPWSTDLPTNKRTNGSHSGAPSGSVIMKKDAKISEIHLRGPDGANCHVKNLRTGVYYSMAMSSSPENRYNIYKFSSPIEVNIGDILVWVASGNIDINAGATGNSYWDSVSTQQKRPVVNNDFYDVIRTDVQTESGTAKAMLDRTNKGDWNNTRYTSNYTLFALKVELLILNTPPTSPANLKILNAKELYLANEEISIEWEPSTDEDKDPIAYEADFYDGVAWHSLSYDVVNVSLEFVLPKAHTDNAQFRVRAKDGKGGYSDYTYSNTFKLYRYLILLLNQDNEILKSREVMS